MKSSSKILMVIAFVVGLLAYNLWPLWGAKWFYGLIALEFVILYFIFWMELKGTWKLVAQAMVMACINSLVDEMFFDPGKISLNEYIGFAVIVVTTFLVYGKGCKARKFKR